MSGVTLDSGALIGLERGNARVIAILSEMTAEERVYVPAGVVAQAWRGGVRQVAVARLLSARQTVIVPLDDITARATGLLCAKTGHSDVVDVSVALCARQRKTAVVTADPGDISKIDPKLQVFAV